ncbi:uncharacterized protein [Physcomitrium patens]|uniref:uncharacterized protein isoform X3 n=1 Tax=Physcomitrium patens TaxID=3218 RepID=UPI003CCE33BB
MRASPRTCLDLLDSCEGPVSSVFWLLGLSSIECGSSNYWSKCFEIIQAIFLFETSCDDSCFQFFRFYGSNHSQKQHNIVNHSVMEF